MKNISATRKDLIPWVLRPGYVVIMFIQDILNKLFTPYLNPMYLLGATNFLLFWILLGTGVYLFLFFDMDPKGAYDAVNSLSVDQKYLGGIFRSMHRYASDLMIITITFHLLHVVFMDRFRKARRLAWFIGVTIIPLFWVAGITGYFLAWDQKAQIITLYVAQAFDMLGVSAEPVVRNFLYNHSVNRMLFFLMTFAHIVIPALVLVGAWVHCMRVSRPLIGPPKGLAIPILVFLVALSLINPAMSMPRADLNTLITVTEFDWFFMIPIAIPELFDATPQMVWISSILILVFLFVLPFLIPDTKKKV